MNLPLNKQGAIFLVTAAAVAVGLVYFLRKQVADAADLAGGVVSGNNAITAGTVYQGTGVAGTLGAAADSASGGTLSSIGEWIGGKAADVADLFRLDAVNQTQPPPAGSAATSRKQAVIPSFFNRGYLQ